MVDGSSLPVIVPDRVAGPLGDPGGEQGQGERPAPFAADRFARPLPRSMAIANQKGAWARPPLR